MFVLSIGSYTEFAFTSDKKDKTKPSGYFVSAYFRGNPVIKFFKDRNIWDFKQFSLNGI